MRSAIRSLDDKIEEWIETIGKAPRFVVLGRHSYLKLCEELTLRSGATETLVIRKFRQCAVVVLPDVDILEAVGIEGIEGIYLDKV